MEKVNINQVKIIIVKKKKNNRKSNENYKNNRFNLFH